MAINKTKDLDISKIDRIIIDTNVLAYIFFPINVKEQSLSKKYIAKFNDIINNNIKIVLTDVQISEIVNLLSRRDWRNYCNISKSQINYKDYRKTKQYMIDLEIIKKVFIKQILPVVSVISFCDNGDCLKAYFNQYDLDYNDKYITRLARYIQKPIITHDSDFIKAKDVDVYTELST